MGIWQEFQEFADDFVDELTFGTVPARKERGEVEERTVVPFRREEPARVPDRRNRCSRLLGIGEFNQRLTREQKLELDKGRRLAAKQSVQQELTRHAVFEDVQTRVFTQEQMLEMTEELVRIEERASNPRVRAIMQRHTDHQTNDAGNHHVKLQMETNERIRRELTKQYYPNETRERPQRY